MAEEKSLLLNTHSGLANRLRALVGFKVWAELEDRSLLVAWESTGACAAEFATLFCPPDWPGFRLVSESEAKQFALSYPGYTHKSAAPFTDIWQSHAQHLCSSDAFSRAAVASLRGLRPVATISEAVDSFAVAHNLRNCIGIHIRMTDNVHSYQWWIKNDPHFQVSRISKLDGFVAAIDQFEETGQRVFVSTDSEAVAMQIAAKFSNVVMREKKFDARGFNSHVDMHYRGDPFVAKVTRRLRELAGRASPSTWRTTDVTDALIDMLLLSRCQQVVGSYWSSFGWLAAVRGNVPFACMEGETVIDDELVRGWIDLDRGRQ